MMCGFIVFLPLLAFICTFSEGKKCQGQRLPQLTLDNTESVKSCIKRGGKCCSVLNNGNYVTWDGGSDMKESCDWCWTGKSRNDIYENLEWFVEKIFDQVLSGSIAFGMGKMWDKAKASDMISWDWMWKDSSGTKKQ